ncbi:MAG: calcium/sodium antiporter [Marinagarivorans sp.]|nr:calcium/sodium antiporter [Marinagarivorans sp.]
MVLAAAAILLGFIVLVWSADKFVDGAAATASHFGMPSLLVGMVIVGFGTSAPEMVVSAMAALDGKPDLALGNALGSNIVNTGLILGVTAIITPILVSSKMVHKEIPLLIAICLLLGGLLWDGSLSRLDAIILLVGFFTVIGWSIYSGLKNKDDSLSAEFEAELKEKAMPIGSAVFWLILGFALLLASSRLLVWGAVNVAHALGVSDLIIGLTIVALGTSLPELAASVAAVRKGEHDIAIGNVVGSNMFNILAVVGIAGVIAPMPTFAPEVLTRDWTTMLGLTLLLLAMAFRFKKQGCINRVQGGVLLALFAAYNSYLVYSVI